MAPAGAKQIGAFFSPFHELLNKKKEKREREREKKKVILVYAAEAFSW